MAQTTRHCYGICAKSLVVRSWTKAKVLGTWATDLDQGSWTKAKVLGTLSWVRSTMTNRIKGIEVGPAALGPGAWSLDHSQGSGFRTKHGYTLGLGLGHGPWDLALDQRPRAWTLGPDQPKEPLDLK